MNVLNVLKELNVIKNGHFLLPSGKHSSIYFQCAQLFKHPDKSSDLLKIIVEKLNYSSLEFDKVIGPAIGGIVMSYELARQLKKPVIYIERVYGIMILGEHFKVNIGEKFLIAEDVITSGNTVRESIKLIESLGGIVVGVACVVNKENIKIKHKIYSCMDFDFESYNYNDCPLCKNNIALKNGK